MDDDLDALFGAPKRSFAERVGRQPETAPPLDAQRDDKGYEAFGVMPSGSITESCDVRFWADDKPVGVEFSYRLLLQVAYWGDEELRLHLPDSLIVIEGRNLKELRSRLGRRAVHYVQQHHPGIWPMAQPSAPVVERIEVLRPETFRPRSQ